MVHPRTSSQIELATADYFNASTEALEMFRQVLQNIKDAQSNYQSMDSILASITASDALDCPSTSNNPFHTTTQSNLRMIHEKYSCILRSIRSSQRGVGRKLKLVKAVKKPSSKTMSSLLWLQEQLDTMAKGSYVLGKDLDTVGTLVGWLSEVIEWENTLARTCSERADQRTSVLEMANELRRSCSSSNRLTEELEEHVCLFLETIHTLAISYSKYCNPSFFGNGIKLI